MTTSTKQISRTKITQAAVAMFEGDRKAAHNWLNRPCNNLNGKCPVDVAKTPNGREKVMQLLNAEHAVVS